MSLLKQISLGAVTIAIILIIKQYNYHTWEIKNNLCDLFRTVVGKQYFKTWELLWEAWKKVFELRKKKHEKRLFKTNVEYIINF